MHEGDEENLTWAGRRLLKPWYLDELPQIWNVLRGHMSLVGPRPWPPSMVASQVAKGFTYRNEFIAGWTGSAQVQKGVTEPAGYAELDIAYVRSCWTWRPLRIVRGDLALLWRTVVVMAKGGVCSSRRAVVGFEPPQALPRPTVFRIAPCERCGITPGRIAAHA